MISRAAVLLMSAAAEQLGLAAEDPDRPAHRDLDQARTLITALAGLLKASLPDLGPHAAAFRDGLRACRARSGSTRSTPTNQARAPASSSL